MAEIDITALASDVEKLKADVLTLAPIVGDVVDHSGLAPAVNAILDWIEKNGGERIAAAIPTVK